MTQEQIKELIQKEHIETISLWFTDVLGQLKTVTISYKEINDVLENGKFIDGSSIEGFSRIEESDLLLLPDFDTFAILPFDFDGASKMARLICDVAYPDGRPYESCPRQTLKRSLQNANEKGYTVYCGPELEYFYFKTPDNTEKLDKGGYFDLLNIDQGTKLREKTLTALERIGIQCECAHHEVAPSQHEIGLKYKEALKMADTVITYKFIVKAMAQENGVFASFMPKPLSGENGSGMHTHISVFKDGQNLFYDKDDAYSLSAFGKSFTAGALKYSKEICLITNQYINSYKRLVPGFEAPVYIAWARSNRSALIRIPATRPGKEKACRIELRFPDPSCNPYLAFSVMLSSGLQGVLENLSLQDPHEKDIYEMNDEQRKNQGIDSLPGSLRTALHYFTESELIQKTLGKDLHNKIIENKKIEWNKYKLHVTDYEIEKYLPIL
ncbi:MAG: glutamine synthetase family protein [Patescibacteria group bacterium]